MKRSERAQMKTQEKLNNVFKNRYHTDPKIKAYHIAYAKAYELRNPGYNKRIRKEFRKREPELVRSRYRAHMQNARKANPLIGWFDSSNITLKQYLHRVPPTFKNRCSKRGCNIAEFKEHMSVLRQPAMIWSDFRKTWTLIPVKKWREFKDTEKHLAFHYSNFIPTWKKKEQ